MRSYDVVVLGAGPAGLAAGLSSHKSGAKTLIIEREARTGGILKQCIHDGFGLIKFKQKLSGPEYAERYIKMVHDEDIPVMTSTFVLDVKKEDEIFRLTLINKENGMFDILSKALILANGCRERTAKQVFIHGTRAAGVYTAGTAQYFVNIMGYLPCKRCVILGSGDIGLIMARRLTLEGAEVLGVYEAKPTPSGLSRNIVQCLEDFSIPLHLSHTITRIIGNSRVEAVEICEVDENMTPIIGTEEIIECDGVILSVGLIPENEIAEKLKLKIDNATKGPYVDQNFMTTLNGVFSCGNALHVNDLVDYVSESGEYAGKYAAEYCRQKESRKLIPIKVQKDKFLYAVPQFINKEAENNEVVVYYRSKYVEEKPRVQIKSGNNVLFDKKYRKLKPPEMQRALLKLSKDTVDGLEEVNIIMGEE